MGADSTSRVGAKIFDLADVPALSFNIAQDNSLELLGLFRGSSSLALRLHEGVFRHEEVVASLLSSDSLAKLRVTALSLGYFLLNPRARAGFPDREDSLVARHSDSDLYDLVLARSLRRLGALGRSFLEAAGVTSSTIRIDSVLAWHGVSRSGRVARLL